MLSWRDFEKRTEVLARKGGGTREVVFLENENGVLQGDAQADGYYLIENYAALRDCGASFNWLLADAAGNIGYQMSGRHFVRPEGTSGLLPLPAWDERYAHRGLVDGDRLPQAYNPPEAFLVSANDDRNAYGTTCPCAVNLGSYRKDRITALLAGRDRWTAEDMGAIQSDVYSAHARRCSTGSRA